MSLHPVNLAEADRIASDLVTAANREEVKAALDNFGAALGQKPPEYCIAVATAAANAIFQTDNPVLMRAVMMLLIDRMLAEAVDTALKLMADAESTTETAGGNDAREQEEPPA